MSLLLWLELLMESEIMNDNTTKSIHKEANEIAAVLAKARKTTGEKK